MADCEGRFLFHEAAIMNFPLRSGHLAAATLVLLGATLVASKMTAHRRSGELATPLETLPRQIGEFSGTDNPPLKENVLKELKATQYLSRTYRRPGLDADLFIAFYAQQRAGESMHSPKHCLPGAGWEIWDYGAVDVPANGRVFRINKDYINHEGNRRVVLYWYQSKERIFASEYIGKILLARDALIRNSTAAAIVRIIVPDRPGVAGEASAFASELIPEIQRCFGQ
jgi:EpsI family protein